MTNILIVWVDDHLGVTDGVFLCLVYPRIEGRHVDVLDLLSGGLVDLVMKFDGIGASAEEGVAWIKRVDEFQGLEEWGEVWMGFDLQVPLAFPHDVEVVAVLPEKFVFPQGGFIHFLHGTVRVEDGIPVAVEWKAARAPVPQASVEFVDGGSTCDGITGVETVDQMMDHAHFASVSDGPDAISWSRMLKA